MSPQGARPAVVGVNYYRGRVDLVSAAAIDVRYFKNQTGSGLNDLGESGILPDNRSGQITAIMMRCREFIAFDTPLTPSKLILDHMKNLNDLMVELYINNVEVFRGPWWTCPHPPTWVQGTFTEDAATDQNTAYAQNGGYMLASIAHDVGARQSIQGRVHSDGNSITFEIAANIESEMILQIADRKAVL